MAIFKTVDPERREVVIAVKGGFDFHVRTEFREAYATADRSARYTLDMREADSIDSSALGLLLNMKQELKKNDGEIRIINCSATVLRVLQIAKFQNKFCIE